MLASRPALPGKAASRCASCGSPVDPETRRCSTCGAALDESALPAAAEPDGQPLTAGFGCQSCGAQVLCEPGYRSYECAFCGSTYVVELPGQGEARLSPDFVVPFRLDHQQAQGLFDGWCHRGLFTPGDVRKAARVDRLKGVYLPFWTFSMRADSAWQAEIGEYWYQRVAKDKKVRRTEWHGLTGRHHSFHYHYLVSGSKGLPQEEAESVYPFDLAAMRRYRPELLAGWLAEPFSVSREQALSACQQRFLEQEGERIAAFLPGDKHRELRWDTHFSEISDDFVLLPFWIGAYTYQDKVFRFVVNGQTGAATGTRPESLWKIAAAVLLALLAALAIVLFSLQASP